MKKRILVEHGILQFHQLREAHISLFTFLKTLEEVGIKDLEEVDSILMKGKKLYIKK